MCYYSAEGESRPAKGDEVLVVKRQLHETNWLVDPEHPSTPVCLGDGCRVELLYIPQQTQKKFRVGLEARATFKPRDWWRRDVLVLEQGADLCLRSRGLGWPHPSGNQARRVLRGRFSIEC